MRSRRDIGTRSNLEVKCGDKEEEEGVDRSLIQCGVDRGSRRLELTACRNDVPCSLPTLQRAESALTVLEGWPQVGVVRLQRSTDAVAHCARLT